MYILFLLIGLLVLILTLVALYIKTSSKREDVEEEDEHIYPMW